MKTDKLIEWYGRRITFSAKITAVIMIIIFGMLAAFGSVIQGTRDQGTESIEQSTIH